MSKLSVPPSAPPASAREELAYALVTPYSLHKSRTGGILARLLWADVRLVAARMFAPHPDSDFIQRFCDAMYDPEEKDITLVYQKMLIEYVVDNFTLPNERGISNRLMLLLFRGPNAIADIADAVGPVTQRVRGDDVRGTFGEFVQTAAPAAGRPRMRDQRNKMLLRYPALQQIELPERRKEFFEPAVLTGRSHRLTHEHLKLFLDNCYKDGGDVAWSVASLKEEPAETSLVILKPESFRHRDPLPGNLIDFFARTGMCITATRMLKMDQERAKQFYGAKLDQFRRVLGKMISGRARQLIQRARQLVEAHEATTGTKLDPARRTRIAFEMLKRCEDIYSEGRTPGPSEVKKPVMDRMWPLLPEYFPTLEADEAALARLEETLRDDNAQAEFAELIRYMTGGACMALLYTGPGALDKIRTRLKELRQVYGRDILQNRAHASDPDEDPVKERITVGFAVGDRPEETPCDVEREIKDYLASAGND